MMQRMRHPQGLTDRLDQIVRRFQFEPIRDEAEMKRQIEDEVWRELRGKREKVGLEPCPGSVPGRGLPKLTDEGIDPFVGPEARIERQSEGLFGERWLLDAREGTEKLLPKLRVLDFDQPVQELLEG